MDNPSLRQRRLHAFPTRPHVHVSTCTHIHMPSSPHGHVHTCPRVHTSTCTHAHTSTCGPVPHAHASTRPRAHMCTCPRVHIYTCPHLHICGATGRGPHAVCAAAVCIRRGLAQELSSRVKSRFRTFPSQEHVVIGLQPAPFLIVTRQSGVPLG